MKSIKFLLPMLFAFVFGSGNVAFAQTDVTSKYLVNPSFETGTVDAITSLEGWTLPSLGTDFKNISLGNSTACDGNGFGIPSSASDGSQYFFNRKGWSTVASELSQTATLPAGKYYITVDYKAYEKSTSNGTMGFKINDNEIFSFKPYNNTGTDAVNDPWKTIGAWFDVAEEGSVKIAITESLVGGSARADLYLDNVKLYKWDSDDDANYKNASSDTPFDVTAKFVTNPYFDSNVNGWTTTTGSANKGRATNKGGAISGGFWENWNGSAKTSGKMYQTISGLPNGIYRLTAVAFAGGSNQNVSLYLGNGKTSVTSADPALYSVIGNVNDGTCEIGLVLGEGNGANWLGLDNVKLEYLGSGNEALLEAAKIELGKAIIKAQANVPTTNVGSGAFQYNESEVNDYQQIIDTAQDVCGNESATLEDVETAMESIENAAYPTINGPKADTRYNFILKYDGWTYDNKAITYIANGRTDQGYYNIQYLTEANANYAQAFKVTPVNGGFRLSQIDADGEERFMCTGVVYGGNTSQIRTTTKSEDALVVEIRPTATEGKWNLWNTEANQFIGSQDAGIFTVNSHVDFAIAEAQQIPSIKVSKAAQYGTFIAPIGVTVPEGVVAYSCNAIEENTLTLTPVENTILANTPVILYAENGYTDEADGLGYSNKNPEQDAYENGYLTGVYADTKAPAGSYVLQNGPNGVKFYVVEEGKEPTVKANRCYLNLPEGSDVKAFGFDFVDAINAINADKKQNDGAIYNLNGQRLNNLQKGINIINGKKLFVK